MLLPCAIEQRDQAMVEKIEERGQRVIAGRLAGDHPLGVVEGQDTLRPGQRKKSHRHVHRIV